MKIEYDFHNINNPIKFSSHLIKQSKRDKVIGERAANVVLLKFTKK